MPKSIARSVILVFFVISSSFAHADLSPSTEKAIRTKLAEIENAQAHLVERTREFNTQEDLIQKTSNAKKAEMLKLYSRTAYDRKTWEKFFATTETQALQNDIKAFHQEIIAANYKRAVSASKDSKISLTSIKKNDTLTKLFCAQLPKGGILHTHPYGTMDRKTVERALESINPMIERHMIENFLTGSVERLHSLETRFLIENQKFYEEARSYKEVREQFPDDAARIVDFFFVPRSPEYFTEGVTPFSRFLAAFVLPLQMFGIIGGKTENQIALEKIIYDDMFARNVEQKVYYIELTRSLPTLLNSKRFADRYKELLKWTEQTTEIAPRTLLSFNRTSLDTHEERLAQVTTMSQLLSMEPSPYVVGINLMGDESLVDALDASQLIYGKLLVENIDRKTGLQATIHAGELGDVKNLRDAMAFGVRRIGHGIKFIENPLYLEIARRLNIALEISLSSNEILQVATVEQNPFLYFYRLGMPVSLSTDDEGMFQTHPNLECERAIHQTNIEYTELRQMVVNSIETSFADAELKAQLLQKLEADLTVFEQNWKTP